MFNTRSVAVFSRYVQSLCSQLDAMSAMNAINVKRRSRVEQASLDPQAESGDRSPPSTAHVKVTTASVVSGPSEVSFDLYAPASADSQVTVAIDDKKQNGLNEQTQNPLVLHLDMSDDDDPSQLVQLRQTSVPMIANNTKLGKPLVIDFDASNIQRTIVSMALTAHPNALNSLNLLKELYTQMSLINQLTDSLVECKEEFALAKLRLATKITRLTCTQRNTFDRIFGTVKTLLTNQVHTGIHVVIEENLHAFQSILQQHVAFYERKVKECRVKFELLYSRCVSERAKFSALLQRLCK